jgi:hypothetical protein
MVKRRPNNHRDLRRHVGDAVTAGPLDGLFCAAECGYLPHGGGDDVWLELTASKRRIQRVRRFYTRHKEDILITRTFTEEEATDIPTALVDLGVWSLPSCIRSIRDGWVCAVAVAHGVHLHSIQMHNPEGPHFDLLLYLFGLVPLPDELSEWDIARLK